LSVLHNGGSELCVVWGGRGHDFLSLYGALGD